METLTDEQLVALTQGGNLEAFNRLTARWEASVYRFALRTLGDPEDARDVCQEALVKAYMNIRRLREGEKFRAWVHHIALNLCRDRFRSAAGRVETRVFEEEGSDGSRIAMERAALSTPAIEAEQATMMGLLSRAIGSLSHEQRTAILLKEYHGFTSEEVGEITGVPAATVRSRVFYGLKAVRRRMREMGYGEA